MFKRYKTMLKREFAGYNVGAFAGDLMAGLTVTAVALPLALAFGVSCGADAAAGLITAILAGLIIGALSGASFQISGPTGAMSVVILGVIAKFGLNGVFVVSFLAGALILVCSFLKVGRFVSMIPRPVITGFTAGIALTIALGQVDNFLGTTSVGDGAIEKLVSVITGKAGLPDYRTVMIGGIVILVMILWPKKWNARVPSSLVGIIVATVVNLLLGFDITCVGEIPKKLFLDARLSFGDIEWSQIGGYISPVISIAALGMIESLLCGASASRMKNEPFDADLELVAQGVGNMIIPFFGGVPATAAIARTSVAIKSGARTRVCGIVHAFGLLASMFLLGGVMAKLPLAALAGVLLVTAWRMNEWSEIRYIFSHRFFGAIAKFLLTMVATIVFDLTVAILLGIGFSMLLFVIRSAKLRVELSDVDEDGDSHPDYVIAYISGPIFFADLGGLMSKLEKARGDCPHLILSFRGVPSVDTSGVEEILECLEAFDKEGVKVSICGMNESVRKMLERGGLAASEKLVIETSLDKILTKG